MEILSIVLAGLLLAPVLVLTIECLAALLPARRCALSQSDSQSRPPLAVLVPAHDEEAVLADTLDSINRQLRDHDRVVVVADNCSDSTPDIARSCGATVVRRDDPDRRGKGYALDAGLRSLHAAPPDVVVMVDADCQLAPGTLDALAAQVRRTGRPAQAAYLLDCPPNPGSRHVVSALAFLMKNVARPQGLARLGLPCLLTGTGMAFPYAALRGVPLASPNLVEDMQLGLDLAAAGAEPGFCPDALVLGQLPQQQSTALKQRRRWEHGHLQTLLTQAPRLLAAAVRSRRPRLLALACEIAVPPLSLLALLLLAGLLCSATLFAAAGIWTPLAMLAAACLALAGCTLAVWCRFARDRLPLTAVLAAPLYVLWKTPLYLGFLFNRERQWVRTDHSGTNRLTPSARLALSPGKK